ncbi:hypothetical protein LINGRAHAP2_LOCUS30454, partial [Linum grandiflorum]
VPPQLLFSEGISWLFSQVGVPINNFTRSGLDVKLCVLLKGSQCLESVEVIIDDGERVQLSISCSDTSKYVREPTWRRNQPLVASAPTSRVDTEVIYQGDPPMVDLTHDAANSYLSGFSEASLQVEESAEQAVTHGIVHDLSTALPQSNPFDVLGDVNQVSLTLLDPPAVAEVVDDALTTPSVMRAQPDEEEPTLRKPATATLGDFLS